MDAFLWVLDLLKLNPGIRRISELVVGQGLFVREDPPRDGLGTRLYAGTIPADSFPPKK